MLLLAASLFFTTPAPLDMPRAEAYLVKDGGTRRLEDRYSVFDLWLARAVVGRWMDDDFRVFVLSDLSVLPPALSDAPAETRSAYEGERVAADAKKDDQVLSMVDALSPVAPEAEYSRPRQKPRGCKDVRYYHGTNDTAVVCAFLPEGESRWLLATWELADGDDFGEAVETFEREFLEERAWREAVPEAPAVPKAGSRGGRKAPPPSERELLRRDARHGVAAYPNWHATDSDEFVVLDALPARGFVSVLTNDLPAMRAKYAAAVPSPIDGSNTLCVARIYSNREEYLEAAGEGMEWSAAYWNQRRRELVAYLSPQGDRELLKTIRHEAFHQYLSYACSMVAASPWFNEGYAQYFEDEDDAEWGVEADLERIADAVPGVMMMDYGEFYGGSDAERRLKYRIAWSLAYFIEKGAPKVRFEPFKNLKRDYVEAVLKHRDMRKATAAAFGSYDALKAFVAEWKKFWLKGGM